MSFQVINDPKHDSTQAGPRYFYDIGIPATPPANTSVIFVDEYKGKPELYIKHPDGTVDRITGEEYTRLKSVIDIANPTLVPPSENLGDRYILNNTAGVVHANWDGNLKNNIVEFDGTVWQGIVPEEGYVVYVDDQDKDAIFLDDGTPHWELRLAAGATVKEQDGTPSVTNVGEMRIDNDCLVDEGGGIVSIYQYFSRTAGTITPRVSANDNLDIGSGTFNCGGFTDAFVTGSLPLGESTTGESLTGYTATSIVGALNEVRPLANFILDQVNVTSNFTFTNAIPAKHMLDVVVLENTTANPVTIKLGTTATGNELADSIVVAANDITTVSIQKTFSSSALKTIYISSDDWNSADLSVYINYRKVII